jgi:hypothetical protein
MVVFTFDPHVEERGISALLVQMIKRELKQSPANWIWQAQKLVFKFICKNLGTKDKGIIIPVIPRSTIINNLAVGGPRIDIYADHCVANRISFKM